MDLLIVNLIIKEFLIIDLDLVWLCLLLHAKAMKEEENINLSLKMIKIKSILSI